jgi:membrane protease subunit HflK
MAWNEPGGGRDPWGSSSGGNQGPPDLDQVIRNLQSKLGGLFGRGGSGGGGAGGGVSGLPGGGFGTRGLAIVGAVVVAIWAAAGFYIIDPAEEGVVTRFGAYTRTAAAGPHWLPHFVESVQKVNVQQVRTAEIGFRSTGRTQGAVGSEALMLTQDENIIDVKFAIQYRVKDAPDYLFNTRDPDRILRDVTESAVREVVGRSTMDFVITEGRSAVSAAVQELAQSILDRYGTGLIVTSVNMQDAQPPAQVQESFYDAVKAREDEVRFRNEAEAYANEILPKARGDADAIREQAAAYKARVSAVADGDASRFLAVLTEYRKAPGVTRERMYIDAMEDVLSRSTPVVLEAQGSNNILYLPIDKLGDKARAAGAVSGEPDAATRSTLGTAAVDAARRSREDLRRRER